MTGSSEASAAAARGQAPDEKEPGGKDSGSTAPGGKVPGGKVPGSRARGLASLAVLLGAAAAAGSAFMPWWRRAYSDPLAGSLRVTIDGGDVVLTLVPLALVAVAGLGAAMMSRGAVRWVVGLVIAAAGIGSIASTVISAAHTPDAEFTGKLLRPATALSAAEIVWAALVLALIGGALEVIGGVLVARQPGRSRTTSVAYSPPAAQREAVQRDAAQREAAQRGTANRATAEVEAAQPGETQPRTAGAPVGTGTPVQLGSPDPAEWWRFLDAGVDPTDDASAPQ